MLTTSLIDITMLQQKSACSSSVRAAAQPVASLRPVAVRKNVFKGAKSAIDSRMTVCAAAVAMVRRRDGYGSDGYVVTIRGDGLAVNVFYCYKDVYIYPMTTGRRGGEGKAVLCRVR